MSAIYCVCWREYVVERDGQYYALEEDEDFYELKPLKGSKRNFEEQD